MDNTAEARPVLTMDMHAGSILGVFRKVMGGDDSSWAAVKKVLPLLIELARPRRRYFIVALVLVTVSKGIGLIPPMALGKLVDAVMAKRAPEMLLPVLAIMVASALGGAILNLMSSRFMFLEGLRLTAELRCRVQEHVLRLPVAYHDMTKSGTVAKRIMDDASGSRTLLGPQVVDFVGAIVTATFAFLALLWISPMLTLAAVIFAALFALVSSAQFARVHVLHKETFSVAADLHGRTVEAAAGVRVIKGYHAEAQEARMFKSAIDRLNDVALRAFRVGQLTQSLSPLAVSLFTSAVMFLAARQILAGSLTVGALATFMVLLGFLMGPLLQAATLANSLAEGCAGLARAQELLQRSREDQNPRRTQVIGPLTGLLQFEDVSFAYEPGNNVLKRISLECLPGKSTALVGPSGAGKSTIINLVAAFYEPGEGIIKIDGVDLSTVRLDGYRTQLGVVFQDNFLFAGTIRDNVSFARPHATEAEVREACRLAHVDEFAERFPKAYDTVIGERGVKVSGGQRQRIAIARAILADPRILILDEATSSLDSESEAAIQAGLTYLMRGRTTLIIAHRLSTIRNADQILFVERGEIIERGVHDVLYAKSGRYHDLCVRQYQAGSEQPAAATVPALN